VSELSVDVRVVAGIGGVGWLVGFACLSEYELSFVRVALRGPREREMSTDGKGAVRQV